MLKRLPVPFSYVLLTGMALGLVIGFKTLIPHLYWDELSKYYWERQALPHIINYLFWPLLVPFVYLVFNHFRIGRNATWGERIAVVAFSFIIPLAHESITTLIYFSFLEAFDYYEVTAETWEIVIGAFPSVYIGRVVEFWIVYGLFAAFDFYKKYKEKQSELDRIEAQLNRAKLAVLKMQLQPHFLFNALNSISSLMETDVKKGQQVVMRLGDLLRGILEQDERIFTSLKEEMAQVKNYLDIELIRFQDRLSVQYSISPETETASIPALLIQPLVENAIKHGFSGKSGTGTVEVAAAREGDRLILEVNDNGKGTAREQKDLLKKGIGLSNVQKRLKELYHEDHELVIRSAENKGFDLKIDIPYTEYHEKNTDDHSG